MSEEELEQMPKEELLGVIKAIRQENKQLKSILTELEECLNEYKDIKTKSKSNEFFVEIDEVLNYLQELKEKYK